MRLASCLIALVLSAAWVTGEEGSGKGEWIDLFPGEDLKGWKRVPIDCARSSAECGASASASRLQ